MRAIASSVCRRGIRLMLDHVFSDVIGALRSSIEQALLERRAVEERFTTDALLGDTRWETTYSMPGEGDPPRVQADMTLLWPTWSQSAYRSWYLSGELSEVPAIELAVIVRGQGLAEPPDHENLLAGLQPESPLFGRTALKRTEGLTVEIGYNDDLQITDYAIEVSYAGLIELHADVLADGNLLDEQFHALGAWISSTLVQFSDAI